VIAEDEGWRLLVGSSAEMSALGASLAACLPQGIVIGLQGPLGAGKTTLVRGLIQSLGHSGRVKSPTYTLVESYQAGDFHLHHFDLYRLSDPEELELMGVRDYFSPDAVCLVEWPERGTAVLPMMDVVVALHYQGHRRLIKVRGDTPKGTHLLACWRRVVGSRA